MEQGNWIEIIDNEGWRKEFLLQKRIVFIGSDSRNDLVLSSFRGSGVEYRHLQVITPQPPTASVTVVNLSSVPVPLGQAGERSIPPNSAEEIRGVETVHLGNFMLVFNLHAPLLEVPQIGAPTPAAAAALTAGATPGQSISRQNTASIGLKLTLNTTHLRPGAPLEGIITIRNQGSAQGVQFQIGVDGFPGEFLQVGAAPILFPQAEKNISLKLTHPCGPILPAGPVRITVQASAEDAYPGEIVSVSREIQVEPYYQHTLQLIEN